MTIDPDLKQYLEQLNDSCNSRIDKLIKLRESCEPKEKYIYRYIIKKLEVIAGASVLALDKINQVDVQFTLKD